MFTYNQIFDNKKRLLFFPSHPDDIMVYFAGLVNRLCKDGKEVYVVTVSNGARGSKENSISEEALAKQRMEEELAALEYLKVPKENYICLDYKDGEVESNMKLIGEVAKYIRKFKPDIVCTHEPGIMYQSTNNGSGFWVNHRDHRHTGEAVLDAVYPFSRDRSFFPEHAKENLEPHSVFDILLTDENGCNFKFDYTEELDTKKAAMRHYKSQMNENFINDVVNSLKENERYFEFFKYVHLLW